MTFTPRDWTDGELVTAAKMEDLESRVTKYGDSVMPLGVLWQARHETGDYSEWDLGTYGGRQDSGPGTYNATIDSTHAHSGTYSLKMETDTTLGQAGQRNFRWATDAVGSNLPVHGLYTAWYYFDQNYSPTAGDWNIMQWKTKRDSFGSNDPDHCVAVYDTGGSMRLYIYDFHTGSNNGTFSPVGSLAINKWNKVEVEYLRSGTATGIVRAWLNDVQFADLTNIVTRWPTSETERYDAWSVNNYSSENSPDASTIWVDDVSIQQLGRGNKLNPDISYVEFTSDVTISATTEAAANTVVTAAAITTTGYDPYWIEFFAPFVEPAQTAGARVNFVLYDGASAIASSIMGSVAAYSATGVGGAPVLLRRRIVPTAATHTYSIRAFRATANVTVRAASGTYMPGYIRIAKAT